MKHVMAPGQDSMRISAFERTGCLITFLVNDLHDNKIRPQGTETGSFKVPVDDSLLADNAEEEENIRRIVVVPPPQDEETVHHTMEMQMRQFFEEDTAQDDGSLIDTDDDNDVEQSEE